MRIQGPVFTDFAFQAELLAIGRQQQLDGGGIKADTVVKRLHLMFRIDALIAIIAISMCSCLIRRGSRVKSGSIKNGLSATTT